MNPRTRFDSRSAVAFLALSLLVTQATATQAEPLRVATLIPMAEDALAFAEHAVVVATIRRELHQPVRTGVEDLGNPHGPNLEALARARADLVVGDPHIHATLRDKIEALGPKVLLLDSSGVDSTLAALRALGERVDAAGSLEERTEQVASAIDDLKLDAPVRLLLLFGRPGAFFVVSPRAWLGDLAARLGFENLAPDTGSERIPGYIAVNDEALMMLEPDLVALVAHGDPRRIEAELRDKARADGPWAGLGRAPLGIHVLPPALFSVNPGLGLEASARALVTLVESERPSVGARGAAE